MLAAELSTYRLHLSLSLFQRVTEGALCWRFPRRRRQMPRSDCGSLDYRTSTQR
jgi:hypothetical protein